MNGDRSCESTVNDHKAWILNCRVHERSSNDGFMNELFLFIWPFTLNQLIHCTKLQDLFTNETDLILESVIRLQKLRVISVNNNLYLFLFLKQIYQITSEDSYNSTSHMSFLLCFVSFLNLKSSSPYPLHWKEWPKL